MIKGLYEVFAEKWLRGGSVWIYSDPHFADDEMKYLRKNYIGDEEQLKRINSKLGKNDTIIFLGDIGDTNFISKIKGYKVLIMGNHEKGASNYKRETHAEWDKSTEVIVNNFNDQFIYESKGYIHVPGSYFLGEILMAKGKYVDNHLFDEVYEGPLMISDRLLLSHEPVELPSFMFNIHGHDHSNWCKNLKNHMNVCAEHINYTPVNLMNLLKNGLLKDVDDIHRVTIDGANKKKAKKEGKRNAN